MPNTLARARAQGVASPKIRAMNNPDLRHRLVAILAADAVGYSRLMSLDDRATVIALEAARQVFRAATAASNGRVIDMAGDSVLAVFGTATGAVTAALAVQQALHEASLATPENRRMRFRIGVHLGDVIEQADGTVYGDGVNIAARLEGLAEPGGITVSESIRIAVGAKVAASFEDRGLQQVKNIADPVRTYRVRRPVEANPAAPVAGAAVAPAVAVPRSDRGMAYALLGVVSLVGVGAAAYYLGGERGARPAALEAALPVSAAVRSAASASAATPATQPPIALAPAFSAAPAPALAAPAVARPTATALSTRFVRERPSPPSAATGLAKCSDILQKASLEALTANENAYLKKECK